MRTYRGLLHFYPAAFRAEYGEEMCAIFSQRLRLASGFARLGVWIAVFFEVLFNALAVHFDILWQDLRYTGRALRRAPGFAITAILVTALGVGANTAVFSLTDHVLIRPLPFPQSDRLVKLWERLPGYSEMEPSPANYRDWKKMATAFEGMGAFTTTAVNLVGQGDPQRLEGAAMTADVLPTLGITPLFGRTFTEADDREGAPPTMLLSYGLWQGLFGSDPTVIGRKLLLDDRPYLVIGVMPREFRFPGPEIEFWTAAQFAESAFQDRSDNSLEVVARLRPGVTLEAARAEMSVIAGQLERQYPKDNTKVGAVALSMRDELSNKSRLLLWVLMGAALCVLLIACANVANLLLARALVREKELAVRAAMGAGRERLVRQLATESLVLAVLGGLLGVVVAFAGLPLLVKLVPTSLPISQAPSLDLRVLAFAGILTLLTGTAFGVLPALRIGRRAGLNGLREGARAGGGRKGWLRAALVVAEVSVSIVLLVCAGLLMRALLRIQAVDPGFRADRVLALKTALPMPKFRKTEVRAAFYNRILTEVRRLPGVVDAAYIGGLPMVWGGGIWPVSVNGEVRERVAAYTASMRYITPGFFGAMTIPLHQGRDVSDTDTVDRQYAAVVSDSFVQKYWPHENPLGRHFQFALHDRLVVGVVGDIHVRGLEGLSEPQVYIPYRQVLDGNFTFYAPRDLVVKGSTNPAGLLPAIRQIIRDADAQQPVSDVRMLSDVVDSQTAPRSIQLRVVGVFAAIAFLLAAIGIHGLLSFAVSQRTPEIGVRLALGARAGDILGMVMRQGTSLAVAGVVPGIVLAYAAGHAMQSVLAGVEPADALTFASATVLAIVMTVAGSFLPAMRAVNVDPLQAMRAE
ncbi:MAG TPA: ABC transporter permease [Bryobacteraceae bacterium]|nr:ABC transporter permease [Bryobacteraceae bacterium]